MLSEAGGALDRLGVARAAGRCGNVLARMRSAGPRLLIFLAISVMLVLLGAPARAQYLCRMMGFVGTSCCCPAPAKARGARREATLRTPDCCERVAAVAPATVATPRDAADSVPAASLAATLMAPVYDVAEAQLSLPLPASARAPPIERPPLFIVHCALLI